MLHSCLFLFSSCKTTLSSFNSLVTILNWVNMTARPFRRSKTPIILLSSCLTFLWTDSIGLPLSLYCIHSVLWTCWYFFFHAIRKITPFLSKLLSREQFQVMIVTPRTLLNSSSSKYAFTNDTYTYLVAPCTSPLDIRHRAARSLPLRASLRTPKCTHAHSNSSSKSLSSSLAFSFSSVSLCTSVNLAPQRTVFCAFVPYSWPTSMVQLCSKRSMYIKSAGTPHGYDNSPHPVVAGRYVVGRSVDSCVSLWRNSVPLRILLVPKRVSHGIIQWHLVSVAVLEAALIRSSFRSVHTSECQKQVTKHGKTLQTRDPSLGCSSFVLFQRVHFTAFNGDHRTYAFQPPQKHPAFQPTSFPTLVTFASSAAETQFAPLVLLFADKHIVLTFTTQPSGHLLIVHPEEQWNQAIPRTCLFQAEKALL